MFKYEELLELLTKKNQKIDKLTTYKVVVEYLKEKLMTSNIAIGDVSYVMSILNYAEDNECISTYFPKYANEELKRVLEVI